MAYSGGQQVFSPYAAMGNSPGMMIDPNGEMTKDAEDLTAAENDWLMNSPERKAWLMGGSNSSVGRGGKMGNVSKELVAYKIALKLLIINSDILLLKAGRDRL